MWMRGLKGNNRRETYRFRSHPMWMRGLKAEGAPSELRRGFLSHPMWMRGLKVCNGPDPS